MERLQMMFVFVYLTVICIVESQDATVRYGISEGRENGTKLGNVKDDSNLFNGLSEDELQRLEFQILTQGNKDASRFDIDKSSGDLETAEILDRDDRTVCDSGLTCILEFTIAVYKYDSSMQNPKVDKAILVEVNLSDVNDNAPNFLESNVEVEVSEAAGLGFEVYTGRAEDLDSSSENSIQFYQMALSSAPFTLETFQTGDDPLEFRILVDGELDRELTISYQVDVEAKDGGTPQLSDTLTIRIIITDTNDNYPTFLETDYNFTIDESPIGDGPIGFVSATDIDVGINAEISYQFSSTTSSKILNLFAISQSTGQISTKGEIDYEAETMYVFTIAAKDHGISSKSATVSVTVFVRDVNDNSPQIDVNLPPGGTVLSESAQNGTFVAHLVVFDADSEDNSIVKCEILDKRFRLEKFRLIENNYKILLNGSLDREESPSLNVTIKCTDFGTPPRENSTKFSVYIDDINDNAPEFSRKIYNTSMEENNAVGEEVMAVTATDKDIGPFAKVTYALHSEVKGRLIIDPNSGVITANTTFDFEKYPQLIFRVLAFDDAGNSSFTSTGTVVLDIIDQNDHSPAFSSDPVELYVREEKDPGFIVGVVSVSDADSGAFGTFVLSVSMSDDVSSKFEFNSNGLLKTKTRLDREEKDNYSFSVTATDLGGRSTTREVIVHVVDENDNVPMFSFPRNTDGPVSVPYNSPVGYAFTQVKVIDKDMGDNSRISYYIDQGNPSDLFNIDLGNGAISLNHKLTETDIGLKINLTIKVMDNGDVKLPSYATLKIIIIDKNVSFGAGLMEDNHANMFIMIAVVSVTAVLSLIMIAVIARICWSRRQKKQNEEPVDQGGFEPRSSNIVFESSLDKTQPDVEKSAERKFYQQNGIIYNSQLSADSRTELINPNYIDSQLELFTTVNPNKKSDDVNSTGSGDGETQDSGRGGSEVDSGSNIGHNDLDLMASNDSRGTRHSDSDYNKNYMEMKPPTSVLKKPSNLSSGVYTISLSNSYQGDDSVFFDPDLDRVDPMATAKSYSYSNLYKTAERRDLSPLRKGQRKVMFSDIIKTSEPEYSKPNKGGKGEDKGSSISSRSYPVTQGNTWPVNGHVSTDIVV